MGKKQKIKARRRADRRSAEKLKLLPPCSYKMCANGRPPGTNLIRKMNAEGRPSGEFLTACDDCIQPMMEGLHAAGVDAQVFTRAALEQLNAGARAQALAGTRDPVEVPMDSTMSPATTNRAASNARDGVLPVQVPEG